MTDRFIKGAIDTVYPEDHGQNEWLRILANEMAKTNAQLKTLIELYLEDNPRKPKPVNKKAGAMG